MHSPCAGSSDQAASNSTPCFNGCFPSSFLASETHHHHHHHTANETTRSNNCYDFVAATSSTLVHPNAQFTNHESLPSLHESYLNFTKAYPLFLMNDSLKADQIRAQEYYHLNFSNTCFDYTGYGLFSYNQQHQKQLCPPPNSSIASSSSSSQNLPSSFLEPPFFEISPNSVSLHSKIVYGSEESEVESRIRERIMRFMNFSEDDYNLVFTANQVSAFKLIADSFEFTNNGNLLTVYDHKSEALQEMINTIKKKHHQQQGSVHVASAEFTWPDLRINTKKLRKMISKKQKRGLFVFPVHSRITGSPYSYIWMSMAQENGWHVMLDACALAPKEMDTLGLSLFKPDFLVCSFYRVFGENPSGFGCLFVKKSSVSVLRDSSPNPNAGIVSLVNLFRDEDEKIQTLESSKSRIIECRGLDHAEEVGLIGISSRGRYLVNWVVNALMSLQHPNSERETGLALIKIYGPKINSHRGHALAFNVFDWKGEKVDTSIVQKLADRNNISLSCGVLKNMRLSEKFDDYVYDDNDGDFGVCVLTAALNFLTNFEDVYKLWSFLSRFLDADFVEKERWRYMALNQKTLEV